MERKWEQIKKNLREEENKNKQERIRIVMQQNTRPKKR